jgi:chemotaxis protein MotB
MLSKGKKEGAMNWKGQIVLVLLLTLAVLVAGGCVVSKKDYMLKVEEGENLSRQLASLNTEHERLKGEKESLDKQLAALTAERDELEQAKNQLQLKNVSLENEVALVTDDNVKLEEMLQAKSDTLSKHIVDLRAHVADLKDDNTKLKKNIETLNADMSTLQDQVLTLQKENEALKDQAETLERQRKEEILAMKGTYESLLENMESEIEKGEITITQLKGKLKVNMLDEILFDSGKTTIKPQGVEVLKRVGKVLLDVEDRTISIEGNTDNVPIGAELSKKYPTNWELSAARATQVARYLQEEIGIDPGLLSATGYGEYHPVASNDTEEGRAKNRRIDIVLIPMEITPASRE